MDSIYHIPSHTFSVAPAAVPASFSFDLSSMRKFLQGEFHPVPVAVLLPTPTICTVSLSDTSSHCLGVGSPAVFKQARVACLGSQTLHPGKLDLPRLHPTAQLGGKITNRSEPLISR